jgi:UDP-glucose 4-epimerase
MNILVTGGAGFIGSHVLEQLNTKDDVQVVVYDNLSSGSASHVPEGMELVEADILDNEALEAVFAAHSFDAVIHLAAQTMVPFSVAHPLLDCQINLGGVLHVLECCRTYEVPHVLFSSSAAVYGDNPHVPLRETEPVLPTSPYGITKMTTEQYLRVYHDLYGIDATVFRFANVYGERQGEKGEGGVVSIFCKLLSQGKGVTVFGDGRQTRDFVYAGDIAHAIIGGLSLKGFHIINVSTGKETSLHELIRCFALAVGTQVAVTYTTPRKGDILRSVLSNEALQQWLHLTPAMTLEQGIAKTYTWYKENQ